jgi:ribose transport system substrate-binding protein
MLFGNDGDTAALEQIKAATITATVNTSPFIMGQVALQVTLDLLDGKYPGGWVETPTEIIDKSNVLPILQHPEKLYPKPAQAY